MKFAVKAKVEAEEDQGVKYKNIKLGVPTAGCKPAVGACLVS